MTTARQIARAAGFLLAAAACLLPSRSDAMIPRPKTAALGALHIPKLDEAVTNGVAGVILDDSRWTYTWDMQRRLRGIESRGRTPELKLEFTYDPEGRRIRKQVWEWSGSAWVAVRSHHFTYLGWRPIEEVIATATNEIVRQYVWGLDLSGTPEGAGGIGGLVAIRQGETVLLPLCDAKGNVRHLVDSQGAIVASYDYDPFGRLIVRSGASADACPLLFSTKYLDEETGFYYFGYRYYDPESLKWLCRDPLGEAAGPNLTAFCRNDPVNNSDPLGLAGWTRRGHHLVPVSEIEKIEKVTGTWSDDVVEALDAQRIILASRHGWETGHAQYNLRIRGIREQYLKETKVDPTTITGNAADNWVAGLVRDIERSGDDFIEGYLKMVRSERSVREIGEWAARYRHGVLTGALTGRGVFWLEKNGNDAVQLAGRALAGATTRRGAKLFKLAGPAVVIYFVAASADANQAVEAILPPGMDFAWSYTGRLYDRTIDGAREMGLGHPTPAQLEDEVPFIRGIAQRGVLLRESLERRFSE